MASARPGVERLVATTPQGAAGELIATGEYLFGYYPEAPKQAEISLLLPRRAEQYRSPALFPLFQMNLPEGYMLELLRNRFAKTTRFDPMLLLALTGRESAIGRVALHSPDLPLQPEQATTLATILANEGAEDLFQALARQYLQRTGISGVQPKLLVPATEPSPPPIQDKGTLYTSEFIVKAAGEQYPGLPVNEFICMSIAREAGIPVPDFFLSEDLKRFVMRRFDRTPEGRSLGFEDMAVLTNHSPEQKYDGDYTQLAKVIEWFCAPGQVAASQAQLFDQVALSCMLGNGDAHLKNFGLLYTDPTANDATLAPAYDIVCTTCYLPNDSLALSMMGRQGFFQARADLQEFGERYCHVSDVRRRLGKLIEAAEAVLYTHQDLLGTLPSLEPALRAGVNQFADTFGHDHPARHG